MEGTPKPLGNEGFLDARLSGEPPRRDELCFEKWWRACSVHATHALLAPIYAIHLFPCARSKTTDFQSVRFQQWIGWVGGPRLWGWPSTELLKRGTRLPCVRKLCQEFSAK